MLEPDKVLREMKALQKHFMVFLPPPITLPIFLSNVALGKTRLCRLPTPRDGVPHQVRPGLDILPVA